MKKIIFILATLSTITFSNIIDSPKLELTVETHMEILGNGILIVTENGSEEVSLEHGTIILSDTQVISRAENIVEIKMGTYGSSQNFPAGIIVELELTTGSLGNNLISPTKNDIIPHELLLDINGETLELKEDKKIDSKEIVTNGDEMKARIASIIKPNLLGADFQEGEYFNTSTLKVTILSK